jgi:hypothetical protein
MNSKISALKKTVIVYVSYFDRIMSGKHQQSLHDLLSLLKQELTNYSYSIFQVIYQILWSYIANM